MSNDSLLERRQSDWKEHVYATNNLIYFDKIG